MTLCEDCEYMHPSSRQGPSYRAICMKHPRLQGTQNVAKGRWDRDSPYMYCRDINGGNCPLFEERKTNENE